MVSDTGPPISQLFLENTRINCQYKNLMTPVFLSSFIYVLGILITMNIKPRVNFPTSPNAIVYMTRIFGTDAKHTRRPSPWEIEKAHIDWSSPTHLQGLATVRHRHNSNGGQQIHCQRHSSLISVTCS